MSRVLNTQDHGTTKWLGNLSVTIMDTIGILSKPSPDSSKTISYGNLCIIRKINKKKLENSHHVYETLEAYITIRRDAYTSCTA